jgi:ferric-chelate reductase
MLTACGGFVLYDSSLTDPIYANYYLFAWAGLLALATILTLPSILRYCLSGRWRAGGLLGRFGLFEELDDHGYQRIQDDTSTAPTTKRTRLSQSPLTSVIVLIQKFSRSTIALPLWTTRLPFLRPRSSDVSCNPTQPLLPFTVGSFILFLTIPGFICAALFPASDLIANANRFGFIALAALPPLFLLSSKSSPIAWLTGKSWTAVNFLHRWLGRGILLLSFLHGYFWAIQTPAGQLTAWFAEPMQVTGIAATAFLLLIAVSSIKPVRAFAYSLFFVLHYVGIIGFLVFVNMHTGDIGKLLLGMSSFTRVD